MRVGLVASLFFKEVRVETATTSSDLGHIKETLSLLAHKKAIIVLLGLVMIYTFASEALFALYQPYFQSLHIELGQFGLFYAVISIFSAIGALSVTALVKKYGTSKILLFMMFAVLCTLGVMLLKIPGLTYLAIVPSSVAFGFVITLKNASIQKLISSRHQATALSIASLLRNFSFLAGVMTVGVALDFLTVPMVNTMLTAMAAALCLPFLAKVLLPKARMTRLHPGA